MNRKPPYFLSIIFFFLFISSNALATITIKSVGGTSLTESDANGAMTIYGGIAGTCASPNGSGTCSSCVTTTTPAQACNPKSVYGSLPITITFSSDKALNGVKVKITTDSQTVGSESSELAFTTGIIAAGSTSSVNLTWGYLCKNDLSFGNENCTPAVAAPEVNFTTAARKIYLYVDENNDNDFTDDGEKKSIDAKLQHLDPTSSTVNQQIFCTVSDATKVGMCGYELAVGDSKFYLQKLFTSSTVENTSPAKLSSNSPEWYGLAFFAVDVANVNLIANNSLPPQIRQYDSQYGLPDNTVTGLENYKNYCLLMGNVSKAQNIYRFSNDTASPVNTCAQPSEVVGMLTDKSCFISTAAFGSDMADQVQLLREFRNEFLLTNSLGQTFVKIYYKFSPPIAHFIERSEILKAVTRGVLYPFIALAWIALNLGILPILVILFGATVLIYQRKRASIHA